MATIMKPGDLGLAVTAACLAISPSTLVALTMGAVGIPERKTAGADTRSVPKNAQVIVTGESDDVGVVAVSIESVETLCLTNSEGTCVLASGRVTPEDPLGGHGREYNIHVEITIEQGFCDHEVENLVILPSHTEPGCTIHACAKCGGSWTDSYVPPLGHTLECFGMKPITLRYIDEIRLDLLHFAIGDRGDGVYGYAIKIGDAWLFHYYLHLGGAWYKTRRESDFVRGEWGDVGWHSSDVPHFASADEFAQTDVVGGTAGAHHYAFSRIDESKLTCQQKAVRSSKSPSASHA